MKDINKAVSLFIDSLTNKKRYSQHTLRAYKHDLDHFFIFLELGRVGELTPYIVSLWLDDLSSKKLSSRTIARKLSVLKQFFEFTKYKKLCTTNPFLLFSSPKSPSYIPTVMSISEIFTMFQSMPINTILERRNKYILEFMYSTGMRSEEICLLKMSDYNKYDAKIKIVGKGKKERVIPLIPYATKILEEWGQERLILNKKNRDFVFLSRTGKPLTTSMIRKIVEKSSRNLKKHIHPHVFRYTFATHLLDNKANLRHIQELLGHASLSVTQRYTKISINHLQEKFQICHPRA